MKLLSLLLLAFGVSVISAQGYECDSILMALTNIDPINERTLLYGIITKAYNANIRNAFMILDYIERFPVENFQIPAYRILFDEIRKINQDLFTPELMLLAYRLHSKFANNNKNEHLIHIRKYLPKKVLNFPWDKDLYIKNVQHKEFVYSPYEKFLEDLQNHMLFTWRNTDDCKVNPCKWKIKKRDGHPLGFNLWNVDRNELMFAGNDSMLYDNDRRYIYGWRDQYFNLPGGDLWMFSPIEENANYRIYNMYYGEYMYSPNDYYKIDDDRRPLFSWRRSGCGEVTCEFSIIPV